MTVQDIITDDITDVFGVSGNPLSVSAVYTPAGGSAETAVIGYWFNKPLRGDPNGQYDVDQEELYFVAPTASTYHWREKGTVTISGFDYEVAENQSNTENNWAVIALRKPLNNETLI